MTTYKDFDSLERWVVRALDDGLDIIKKKVEEKTPTDTKYLRNNIKKSWINIWKWKVSGEVFVDTNDVPYAVYVESGVKWRVYKYHKWPPRADNTVYYTWVWAKMFQRTADQDAKEITDFISQRI